MTGIWIRALHMKLFLVSAASLFALTLAGAASAATEVELKDVAAKVIVTPENRSDVELKVVYANSKLPVIMVHTEGSRFIADGKLRGKHLNCQDGNGVNIDSIGNLGNADLPTIYIKVPMDAKVSAGGATYGQLGASSSLELNHGGCGNWSVGNVAGKAEINIGGSGDVTAANTGDAEINIGGSGNFKGGTVNHLEANIGGNGDVSVDQVTGPIDVNIGGSGNVAVAGGNSGNMEVNIAGSGDVRHGGGVQNLEVNIVGSGDVRVKSVSGNVSKTVMGSGHIIVGQ